MTDRIFYRKWQTEIKYYWQTVDVSNRKAMPVVVRLHSWLKVHVGDQLLWPKCHVDNELFPQVNDRKCQVSNWPYSSPSEWQESHFLACEVTKHENCILVHTSSNAKCCERTFICETGNSPTYVLHTPVQCFSNRVQRNLNIPHNIVWASDRNSGINTWLFWNTAQNYKCTSKYR
jgi:hypothetical protein